MNTSCHGCGAGFMGTTLEAFWKCSHCGRSNPNEEFIQHALSHIDFNKSRTNCELGQLELAAGRFPAAIQYLESALVEHKDNMKAWCFLALAVAQHTTLADLLSGYSKSLACLARISSDSDAAPLHQLSEAVCRNALGNIAARGIKKFHADARSAWFAYESVDLARARRGAAQEIGRAIEIAQIAMNYAPEDPHIGIPICDEVESLCTAQAGRAPGLDHLRQHARQLRATYALQLPGRHTRVQHPDASPHSRTGYLLLALLLIVVVTVVIVALINS